MALLAAARRHRREAALSLRRRVSGFEDEAWISRWFSGIPWRACGRSMSPTPPQALAKQ
ncbi:hypothetical protein LAUMK13_01588 [Mycobacterium innocens]|uniref:Uncharacterized protein n=1 Tax=Mycobacterium innocens TaxID=2341083 RepID=A0A498PYK9_9MYCO|nr:hypothetical protein LAUMK13_01588 [Mycobacterium innocens]